MWLMVSEHAENIDGTTADLCEGDKLLLYDLLYGVMVPSGNDAALTLAENMGAFLYHEANGIIFSKASIYLFER